MCVCCLRCHKKWQGHFVRLIPGSEGGGQRDTEEDEKGMRGLFWEAVIFLIRTSLSSLTLGRSSVPKVPTLQLCLFTSARLSFYARVICFHIHWCVFLFVCSNSSSRPACPVFTSLCPSHSASCLPATPAPGHDLHTWSQSVIIFPKQTERLR